MATCFYMPIDNRYEDRSDNTDMDNAKESKQCYMHKELIEILSLAQLAPCVIPSPSSRTLDIKQYVFVKVIDPVAKND
jgi:hypothetical protein